MSFTHTITTTTQLTDQHTTLSRHFKQQLFESYHTNKKHKIKQLSCKEKHSATVPCGLVRIRFTAPLTQLNAVGKQLLPMTSFTDRLCHHAWNDFVDNCRQKLGIFSLNVLIQLYEYVKLYNEIHKIQNRHHYIFIAITTLN